ncbi:MAG: class I SAM-dependent methyltransferase [Clostridia bacterium]|jgi:tRNA (adenine22-N1)-methyltransferase|nr:class I SAM-dependent methyltransferase [Clostridia bacterium]
MISKRLKKISEYAHGFENLIDIGTDHAYIPIHLVKNNYVENAVAADVGKGPLLSADKNISDNKLEGNITTILSDGFKNVEIKENTVAIIAGMGGMLINKILSDSDSKVKKLNRLIVQPQRDVYETRKKVHELGFEIIDEDFIEDEGKHYVIIVCEKGNEKYTELEYKYGKIVLETKNKVFRNFLNKQIANYEKIKSKLKRENTEVAIKRIKEIDSLINEFKEVLDTYEA